ncbi:ComF family protein [Flavobacterium columnare]|uniref:Amidophosphoribosyltransferase n=2 Tax=Flavobacterium columnare TaxID=996 RepID=G8XAI8_FLACA|nr:amidophosphoribosyltransferase [Flavobacterium columnare ATCC 49512]PDS25703.1 ComF family protein [Flavobacterium columnare] [Flavobacterium columnare NBRC 100251 = ATCC 23463]GEM56865.1 amidophosphoribosyltransferase [Flavobacterium columnare NBRC 100251 = ATCC 23463]
MYFNNFITEKKIDEMLKKLINLFFPDLCLGCQNLLVNNEQIICLECRHELPLTYQWTKTNNEAFIKFYGRINIEHVSSMFYYHKKGIGQQLIHNLKYKGRTEIGNLLGKWHAQHLQNLPVFSTVNYIIPVPLHPKKLKERGYNQIDTYCESLSEVLKIPINKNLLFRQEYGISQSKKRLTERNNVEKNRFISKLETLDEPIHFLLVDDVLTTGATLEACAKALQQSDKIKISIVTMAFSQS